MRRKIIIITSITVFLLVVGLTITSVFAWYTNATRSASFSIKSANVSSSITLFTGNDNNHDGILELVDSQASYTQQGEATDPSKQETISLACSDIIPTEVYTWKITVENRGDVDAYVSFVLDETSVSQAIMSCLSITIYDESTPSNTKNYIGKMSVGSVLFGGTATDKVDKPGGAKSVISYIVKIEFEIEEALKSQNITINDYQAVQGNEISNLNLFSLILTSDKPVA